MGRRKSSSCGEELAGCSFLLLSILVGTIGWAARGGWGAFIAVVVTLIIVGGITEYVSQRLQVSRELKKLQQEERARIRRAELRQHARSSAVRERFPDLAKNKERQRAPIPGHVQQAVYERDGGACVLCGWNQDLHFDHVIPHSKGGADTVENLRLLCSACNLRKGNHFH